MSPGPGWALEDDAALAAALVRDAGELAARMRAGGTDGLGVETKTSVSDLVTAADRAAETLVVERLAAERPDDGVLGEEGASRPSRSGRTWVIDPVDGTWNFVHGLTRWCSALALVEGPPDAPEPDEALLLGAIYHPAGQRTFVGGPDLPGTCDGEPMPGVPDVSLAASGVATYLHPHHLGTPVAHAFGSAVGGAAALRMMGSGSMDATDVARGVLGLTIQHSVPPWDRLPGAALIRSVGGAVAQADAAGKRWSAAGAPTALAEALASLRPAEEG